MVQILNVQSKEDVKKILKTIGVHRKALKLMTDKGISYCILVNNIQNQAASILKQSMLSLGGDVAVHSDVVKYQKGIHSSLILGTEKQIYSLINKIKIQPYGLKSVADEISQCIKNYNQNRWRIKIRGKYKYLGAKTSVMGILNVTPDSFYDGGKYTNLDAALMYAKQMIKQGADIIDVGGESSRPGSKPISTKEEINRVLPVIKEIKKRYKVHISIDTYKSEIANVCLDAGADIVNDISALRFDKRMAGVVSRYRVPVVLMHMQGTPLTMQRSPKYKDVVSDIMEFLKQRIVYAQENNIDKESIIIDPGIGFGKTTTHNIEILKRIQEFKCLGYPLLMGISMKSFIGNITNTDIKDRLNGTIAVLSYLVTERLPILRVHNIKETIQTIKIAEAIRDEL